MSAPFYANPHEEIGWQTLAFMLEDDPYMDDVVFLNLVHTFYVDQIPDYAGGA